MLAYLIFSIPLCFLSDQKLKALDTLTVFNVFKFGIMDGSGLPVVPLDHPDTL